jgi:hypothetical protein
MGAPAFSPALTIYGTIRCQYGRIEQTLSERLAKTKGECMMSRSINRLCFIFLFALIVAFFLCSCTTTGSAVKSQLDQNITYDVPASAKITKVSYFYEEYKGQPRLHFSVSIQNVTQKPKRYRLNLLLPEGPAVGGMYPRKAKAIKPGETLEQKFPVYIDLNKLPNDFLPTGFTMIVKEL